LVTENGTFAFSPSLNAAPVCAVKLNASGEVSTANVVKFCGPVTLAVSVAAVDVMPETPVESVERAILLEWVLRKPELRLHCG
jgi:hypothetical protein